MVRSTEDLIGGRERSLFALRLLDDCLGKVVCLRIRSVSCIKLGLDLPGLIVIFLNFSISCSEALKLITDLELRILSAIKQFSYCNLLYSILRFFLICLSLFHIAS